MYKIENSTDTEPPVQMAPRNQKYQGIGKPRDSILFGICMSSALIFEPDKSVVRVIPLHEYCCVMQHDCMIASKLHAAADGIRYL